MQRQEIADDRIGRGNGQDALDLVVDDVQTRRLVNFLQDLIGMRQELASGGGQVHAVRRADEEGRLPLFAPAP